MTRSVCVNVGEIYDSYNHGQFKVIEVVNSKDITIEFISTGHKRKTISTAIKSGKIKNPYFPSVYGVGYLGEGVPAQIDGKKLKEYVVWKDMIGRCYDEKIQARFPTYIGCTVCERWHNYQNFYNDAKSLEGYDEWIKSDPLNKYQLDKDVKYTKNKIHSPNKIYSPETCMFITARENSVDANSRRWNKQ
ncbi:hypothetical protein ABDC18_002881 [Escherichia coli]